MTNITELPTEPVRGPAQLLHWLAKLPPALTPALTLVQLATDRRIVAACRAEVDLDGPADCPTPGSGQFAVVVLELPHSDMTEAGRVYLQALPIDPRMTVLDLLLVSEGRWWSALCHDEKCCPATGRSVSSGERSIETGYRGWQSAFDGEEVAAPELLSALQHIAVRDAVLTQIVEPAGDACWRQLRDQLAFEVSAVDPVAASPAAANSAAAFHCINAVVAYLSSDSDSVVSELASARKFVSDYSFARLLQQGIDSGAPAELLRAAIRSCTQSVQSQLRCTDAEVLTADK